MRTNFCRNFLFDMLSIGVAGRYELLRLELSFSDIQCLILISNYVHRLPTYGLGKERVLMYMADNWYPLPLSHWDQSVAFADCRRTSLFQESWFYAVVSLMLCAMRWEYGISITQLICLTLCVVSFIYINMYKNPMHILMLFHNQNVN